MQKHKEKYVKVLVYIPEKLHKEAKMRIKTKAFKDIKTFSALVVQALFNYKQLGITK